MTRRQRTGGLSVRYLMLNGPNMNLLGVETRAIWTFSLDTIMDDLTRWAAPLEVEIHAFKVIMRVI